MSVAQSVPVLLYHSIASTVPDGFQRWTVSPAHFRAQVTALADAGYQSLTVSDAVHRLDAGKPMPRRPVVVTFDDGFRDFKDAAIPVLTDHSFTATLYVTTGYLGSISYWLGSGDVGRIPMLADDDVVEIADGGFEVGAHSRSHAMLDILPTSMLDDEVGACREHLMELTGHPIATFAYPHGYSNGAVRAAVRRAGFDSAASVHHSLSRAMSERFEIPRVIVEGGWGPGELLAAIQGDGLRSQSARHGKEALWRVRRSTKRRQNRRIAESVQG